MVRLASVPVRGLDVLGSHGIASPAASGIAVRSPGDQRAGPEVPAVWRLPAGGCVRWPGSGDRLGLLAAAVFVIPPSLVVYAGVRGGRWSDRHLSVRTQRLPVAVGLSVYVTAVVVLLYAVDAPRPVTATAFTMAALCALTTVLTAVWKVSVHCTVACAFVAVLSCAYDAEAPWPFMAAPLVALIGWSRVRLRAHTVAQVLVGCLLGTAGTAFLWHLANAAAA